MNTSPTTACMRREATHLQQSLLQHAVQKLLKIWHLTPQVNSTTTTDVIARFIHAIRQVRSTNTLPQPSRNKQLPRSFQQTPVAAEAAQPEQTIPPQMPRQHTFMSSCQFTHALPGTQPGGICKALSTPARHAGCAAYCLNITYKALSAAMLAGAAGNQPTTLNQSQHITHLFLLQALQCPAACLGSILNDRMTVQVLWPAGPNAF